VARDCEAGESENNTSGGWRWMQPSDDEGRTENMYVETLSYLRPMYGAQQDRTPLT
jgi:hypothetical protein